MVDTDVVEATTFAVLLSLLGKLLLFNTEIFLVAAASEWFRVSEEIWFSLLFGFRLEVRAPLFLLSTVLTSTLLSALSLFILTCVVLVVLVCSNEKQRNRGVFLMVLL